MHNGLQIDDLINLTNHFRLQEYFCSPRRLIFVNGQVIFKCGWDSPFREDLLSEYQIFGLEDYVYKLPGTN